MWGVFFGVLIVGLILLLIISLINAISLTIDYANVSSEQADPEEPRTELKLVDTLTKRKIQWKGL